MVNKIEIIVEICARNEKKKSSKRSNKRKVKECEMGDLLMKQFQMSIEDEFPKSSEM